jgi:hypothetical protein
VICTLPYNFEAANLRMLDYNFPRKPRFSPFSQLAILLMLVGLLFLFSGLVLALLVSSWLHVPPGDCRKRF